MCKKKNGNQSIVGKTDGLSKRILTPKTVGTITETVVESEIVAPVITKTEEQVKKEKTKIKTAKTLGNLLKFLTVLKWFFLSIVAVLAIITFLGFVYLFLTLHGFISPDPDAFLQAMDYKGGEKNE